jgi:hypothetical protein
LGHSLFLTSLKVDSFSASGLPPKPYFRFKGGVADGASC